MDHQTFHDESWKSVYLGVRGQGQRVCVGLQIERSITAAAYLSHAGFSMRNVPSSAGRWVFLDVGFCTPLSAGLF